MIQWKKCRGFTRKSCVLQFSLNRVNLISCFANNVHNECFTCLLWMCQQDWLKTQTLHYNGNSSIVLIIRSLINSNLPKKVPTIKTAKEQIIPGRFVWSDWWKKSLLWQPNSLFPHHAVNDHQKCRDEAIGCRGASLTADEGYVKDTYSASLENRWCYDSCASPLQRLFSTNVHLGSQLVVTSASACWEEASQWENLDHQ